MFKLLTRISYLLSYIMWFLITFAFVSANSYKIWNEELFWSLFIWFFVWLIFKKLFLSEEFIESRLQFFADWILELNKNSENTYKKEKHKEKTLATNQEETKTKTFETSENYELQESIDNYEINHQIKDEILQNEILEEEIEQQQYEISETENVNKTKESHKRNIVVKPSKFEIAVKKFFSENLLAKLGWVLVFLWVLYLLSLVYSSIWNVWKLIIWFGIWFSLYFTWVLLEKNKFENEWKILLWIGILINYLVILWGRYLLGDTINNNYLSDWTTFLFLILNTFFAVVTALVYKSRVLLLFWFIFAYLNPILIWTNFDTPYTILWYSLIVTIWWLSLSLIEKDKILAISVFILSNILFYLAPFYSDFHWILKLSSSAIVSISTIFVIYKLEKKHIQSIFVISYIFLILLLWNGGVYIKETSSFILYMVTILLYFFVWIYFFLRTNLYSLIYLLFTPIFIIFGLNVSWILINIVPVLAIIVLIYLIWFIFVKDKLPNFLKYIFFIILWIYIFLTNSFLVFNQVLLNTNSFITVVAVWFAYLFTSYYLANKQKLENLYAIWTLWYIFILWLIIVNKIIVNGVWIDNTIQFNLSIASIIIFWIINIFYPLYNNKITNNSSIKNLILWLIIWVLFIWFELFNYWKIYFPWVSLWYAYIWLAIIYFWLWHFLFNKFSISEIKNNINIKNSIYSYLAIAISLFSLAITLIFSKSDATISTIWLFEATVLFYIFKRTSEFKIYIAAIIIFMLWVFDLWNLVNVVKKSDFVFLLPFAIIFSSFILNIKNLDSYKEQSVRFSHDTLHMLWMILLWIMLYEIIPSTWHGWSIFWISIFLFILNTIYSYYNSYILKWFFILAFCIFMFDQIFTLEEIFRKIDNDKLSNLRVLEYISTFIIALSVYLWNKLNYSKFWNLFLNIFFWIYLLLITTIYVYDIFDTTFAITIYWWLSSSILLFSWISNDNIKLRTLWLYLIMLTSLKIFIYDIWLWYWIDDAMTRVIAFIVIWIMFIIISTRYTKKYWNNISKEFNLNNFVESKSEKNENKVEKLQKNVEEKKEKYHKQIDKVINEKIKKIDVSEYRWVKFYVNNWDNFEIRAENLIKIVKLITKDFQDLEFKKWELRDTYNFVINNYETELSKATFDKIVNVLWQFVEKWGRVEPIIKK